MTSVLPKSYILDNGVIVRNHRELGWMIIEYPETNKRMEFLEWNILGTYGNAVYFIINQITRLQKASFTQTSYSVEQLQELPPINLTYKMLNFPYYFMQEGEAFFIRSLISDESFESGFNFAQRKPKNKYTIVGDNVMEISFDVEDSTYSGFTKCTVERYRSGEEPRKSAEFRANIRKGSSPPFPEFHAFSGFMYTIQENGRPELVAIDVATMKVRKIQTFVLDEKRHQEAKPELCITQDGVMRIDYMSDHVRVGTFKLCLASSEVAPIQLREGGERHVIAQNAEHYQERARHGNIAHVDEINELKHKNEEQEKRITEQDQKIAEIEKKYNRLLMMVGRAANS